MNNDMANIALNQLTNSSNGGNRLVAMIGPRILCGMKETTQ